MYKSRHISSFSKGLLLGILILVGISCVSPYEADIENEPRLISIEGSLIKGEEEQTVQVSTTATLDYPVFFPVRGCDVTLLDEFDNAYSYREVSGGIYKASIPDEEMIHGRYYKLRVISGEGLVYESDYEMLNTGVEVDSLYYEIEDKVDNMSGEAYTGLQFYLDVKAGEDESRYFRWRIDETYEYESFAPISYYYLDESHIPVYPADEWEFFTCWKGGEISGLFQSSTMNLTENEKKRIYLNYVSARTERLRIKYSLNVRQYTISENAYEYFEQNRQATEEGEGLYTRQPRQPITNFMNVDDDNERVLGYFWVSTQTSLRIFVPRIEEMDVRAEECAYWEFDAMEDGEGPFPIYLYDDRDQGKLYVSSRECFDCTKRGGTNVMPDYWE